MTDESCCGSGTFPTSSILVSMMTIASRDPPIDYDATLGGGGSNRRSERVSCWRSGPLTRLMTGSWVTGWPSEAELDGQGSSGAS
jgi:hypothetical protein